MLRISFPFIYNERKYIVKSIPLSTQILSSPRTVHLSPDLPCSHRLLADPSSTNIRSVRLESPSFGGEGYLESLEEVFRVLRGSVEVPRGRRDRTWDLISEVSPGVGSDREKSPVRPLSGRRRVGTSTCRVG